MMTVARLVEHLEDHSGNLPVKVAGTDEAGIRTMVDFTVTDSTWDGLPCVALVAVETGAGAEEREAAS